MSEATRAKAVRLLMQGRVDPQPNPAQVFRVEGDSGIYLCFVSASVRYCTCPHGVNGAEGDCSHLEAAVAWVLGEGALADGSGSISAANQLDRRAALARRKARDAEQADAIFDRLGA